MLMTTELYERMNKLCDARVMFDDEQIEMESMVFDAIVAVGKAEQLLEFYEAKQHEIFDDESIKDFHKKVLTDAA